MSNYARQHAEDATGRGPSSRIFGDLAKIQHDMIRGDAILFYDDFAWIGSHVTGQTSGGYPTYQDTGVTITQKETIADTNKELGVLQVANNDADNDEGQVVFGTPGAFALRASAGNASKVMFEARISKASNANDGLAWYCGLGSLAPAANNLVDDTGALAATFGGVGFQCLQDDGDKIDVVYQPASGSLVQVLANAATITNATYQKVGFIFNPFDPDPAKVMRFFIDGAEVNGYVNSTVVNAATFPKASLLSPVLYTKVGTAAEVACNLDWVACAMYGNSRM